MSTPKRRFDIKPMEKANNKDLSNYNVLERILELMSEKGLSDRDFELNLGIGKGMVSHWKYEKRTTFLQYICPICELLETNPNYLFYGVEQTDDPIELSPNEKDLIRMYRMVDDDKKRFLKEGLRLFIESKE